MKKKLIVFGLLFVMLGAMLFGTSAQAEEELPDVPMFYNPKLIISSYEIEEGVIARGEEFTLKLDLTNTNQYVDAYNTIVTFTSYNENVYIVEGDSNVVYFEKIEAGETVSFTMKLGVMEMAVLDNLVLNFTALCNNALGNEYAVESAITPRIEDRATMKIPAISVANKAVVGAKALVSVRYANSGNTPIANIMMNIEGNINEEQKTVNLGELDANEQKYLDYYVTFNKDGEQNLTISFEYQDEKGNNYSIEANDYSVIVYSYVETDEDAGVISTDKFTIGEKELYMLIVVGALATIILVIVLVTFCMKRIQGAKKKEQRK